MKKEFLLGFNYWASHAGLYTWRQYDPIVVERDFKTLRAYGVNTIRIFPLWSDFQPLTEIRFCNERAAQTAPFKMRTSDTPLLYQKFPDSGLDEKQVENMRHLLSAAKENGLKVIVSLVTGWMSGRKLVPQPFMSKDLVKDPEVVLYQCAFIKDLISEIKGFDNVIAYEPGNETNCLSYEVNEYEAELWLRTITNTIRLADPTRPVYAGLHCTAGKGKWNLPSLGKIFDMVTPHPYPLFTPYCDVEKLTAMRASMHAAAENSYYASMARKPSMVQEIGVLGHNYLCDDKVPDYLETSLITSYMTGTEGYLWWCAFDQDHLDFAPYDYAGAEIYLGLCHADYTPKAGLVKMRELQEALASIGDLPAPEKDAVCILSGASEHWERAYGAFMLGVQSGRYIDFCHEEQPLKDAEYYILPCVSDCRGLPKCQADFLDEKIRSGAKLLITYNGGVSRDFEKWTGLRVHGNEGVKNTVKFDVEESVLSIDRERKLFLESESAQVIARDQDGNIAIAVNKYGKGSVMFVNAPLETFYTKSYYPENTELYKIYENFFREKKQIVLLDDPFVFRTVHKLDNGKIGIMLYNFEDEKNEIDFTVENNYAIESVLFGELVENKLIMQKKYAYLILSEK